VTASVKIAEATLIATQAAGAILAAQATHLEVPSLIGAAAAISGSAAAVLFRVASPAEDRPVEGTWRRGVSGLCSLIVGALFGFWMDDTMALLPMVSGVGSFFVGGLMGFGIVAVLQSAKTRDAIQNGVVGLVRRALAAFAGAVTGGDE